MYKRILLKLTCFFLLFFCSSAWGAMYYVGSNGSDTDGDGSQTNPWQHLSYACSQVTTAGDTIHINAGSYTDSGYCILSPGVNIKGAGKDLVTISVTSTGAPNFGAYILGYTALSGGPMNPGNHEISGFTIDGNTNTDHTVGLQWGVRFRGRNDISIHDMKFQDIRCSALTVEGYYKEDANQNWKGTSSDSRYNHPPYYLQNACIYNVETENCNHKNQPWDDVRFGSFRLEAIEGLQIYNCTINENRANGGCGIKHCNAGWLKGLDMHDNIINVDPANGNAFVWEVYNMSDDSRIYDNTFNGPFSLNGGVTTRVPGSDWNLQLYGNTFDMSAWTAQTFLELSHHWLDFYDNYVIGNSSYVRGFGVWTTNWLTANSVDHVRMRNNVLYNTCETGIYISKNAESYDSIEIYGNVIDTVNTVSWGGFGISVIGNSTVSNLKVHNNIVLNCDNRWLYLQLNVSGAVCTNNLIYGNGNDNNYYNIGSGNTISGNPVGNPEINASGNKPTPYYEASSENANIVDSGTDVGLPYNGAAPDIGAYEYSDSGGFLLPPQNLTIVGVQP